MQWICFGFLLAIWAYRIAYYFDLFSINNFFEEPILICESICAWVCFDVICKVIRARSFMNHSIWVYALHANVGAIITKVLFLVLPKPEYFSIANFILTTAFTLMIIEGIAVMIRKTVPPVYRMLSGSRL